MAEKTIPLLMTIPLLLLLSAACEMPLQPPLSLGVSRRLRGEGEEMTLSAFHVRTVALQIVCHLLKVTELMGETDPWLPCSGSHACLPHSPRHTWNSAGHCQHGASVPRPTPSMPLVTAPDSHLATSQMGHRMGRQGFQSFVRVLILSPTLSPKLCLTATVRGEARRKCVHSNHI